MDSPLTYNAFALLIYALAMGAALARTLLIQRATGTTIQTEALGSRQFGALIIGVAIAETMLGPADALALSQNALKYGLIWMAFPLGAALAQFVSARFFVGKIYKHFSGRLSIGDIFEERCGRSARVFVGVVVVAQAIAFSGVLALAGGQVLQSFMRIDITFGIIATALTVGLYTSIGGVGAVIRTNTTQAAFAWIVAILAGVSLVAIALSSSRFQINSFLYRPPFFVDNDVNTCLMLFCGVFHG